MSQKSLNHDATEIMKKFYEDEKKLLYQKWKEQTLFVSQMEERKKFITEELKFSIIDPIYKIHCPSLSQKITFIFTKPFTSKKITVLIMLHLNRNTGYKLTLDRTIPDCCKYVGKEEIKAFLLNIYRDETITDFF